MKTGCLVVCAWKGDTLLRSAYPFEFGGSFLENDKRDWAVLTMAAQQAAAMLHTRKLEAIRVERDDDPLKKEGGTWTDPSLAEFAWRAIINAMDT